MTPESMAKTGSEDAHCMALMCQVALNVKKYPSLKWLHHIPNGGYRNTREGAKFRAMGVKKGVCDYFLPYPMRSLKSIPYAGLYIEMKIESRRKHKNSGLSDEQVECIAYLREVGYYVAVCYSWQEAWKVIEDYLKGRL